MTPKKPPTGGRGRKKVVDDRELTGPAARVPFSARELEGVQQRQDRDLYVLRLYVAGLTDRSAQAVERVRELCQENLKGRYELEVIDIYQLPVLAKGEQIIATPTLIRVLPTPLRRYIGNLSKENIVFGLDLRGKWS